MDTLQRLRQDQVEGDGDYYDGDFIVTSVPQVGVNYGGKTVQEFLNNIFRQQTNPTATISTGTTVYERMASGENMSVTLNYSVSRPVGCPAITSVVIDGQTETAPDIAEGNTHSGSVSRALPRNTNKTFTITVVAGSKQTVNSISVLWRYARYWGALSKNTNITDADILSLSGAGVGDGKELNETRTRTYNGINGDGNYLVFVFPSSAGTPQFFINGLNSTAFTKVRDNAFTNALGATYNVQAWVSNSPFNSPVAQFEIR